MGLKESERKMGISRPMSAGIGVWELFGTISGTRRLRNYTEAIDALKNSRRVKAVIINVDCPGGLATASDFLYCAVSRLSAKKPVVVFISGTCASGAYLASCPAARIVALPTAVIGSIGVLSVRPIVQDLLSKIGVHVDVTKSGRLKDMGSFYREATEEEKKKEEELIAGFYDYFVAAVAKGRKMEVSKVKELATGEVFLGEKAKTLGLIDEVGDLDRAIDIAAELGKVGRRLMPIRRRPGLYERLFMRFSDESFEEALVQAEGLLSRRIFYLG
jgi:protease-4